MIILILLLGLSMLLVILIVDNVRSKRTLNKFGFPATKVPSWPFGLDEIRTLLATVKEGRLLEELLVRSQLYGHTYQMNILGTPLIVTDDPDNIKAVLATQFKEFGKGPQFHSMSKDFLGDSIFSTDGQPWHVARALLRPQFTKDRLSDLEVFEQHTQQLISHIGTAPVDVLDLFFRLTMDVTTEFLLGDSINSLNSLGDQTFPNAFMICQEQLSTRARMGAAWRLAPSAKNYKTSIKILNDFFEPYIERVQSVDPAQLEQKSQKQYNFLEALAVENKDKKFLRDQMVAVLLAGRDTTGITLSWTFYYLAKNPDIYQKLRKEILDRLGSERCPDANDLQEIKYVHHVLSEVLRLCPVLPVNMRQALQNTSLPRGGGAGGDQPVQIAKGSQVCYSPFLLQRRKDIFGPDVTTFNPDRWKSWTPRPWTYLPFNGGPRLCAGQMYALYEMRFVVVRLVQRFERLHSHDTKPHVMSSGLLLQPRDPVMVEFMSC